MKKIEITLENELHQKLERASARNSKPMKRLIKELLVNSLQNLESQAAYSDELLAEGYRAMNKENAKIIEDALAAQVMALDNESDNHDGSNS